MTAAGRHILAAAALVWGLVAVMACSAVAGKRLEIAAVYRSLGYRDVNEPRCSNPSAGILPEHGGWTRNWSETRAYVALSWRLADTRHVVFAPGFHLGTSVGRFEAKNVGIGFYEAWETHPALLWGPSVRLILRREPGYGAFLLARYELFIANAPEAREDVASSSGTGTPPSQRDAAFSWHSHEATLALGYDWGKVAVAAGAALTAFRLDKRLTHHIDPSGATGTALAAILALNARPGQYGYEPQSLVAPYLAVTFRPLSRLRLAAELRPAAQTDCALSLAFTF
ncbi:hypothetical protein [Solidesulfovibrio sp. C21]|uniref:hypothetical protein n=1 Tax=Solidesulfovibrio sp. C21 TaxID=3398613 RepID=UPI0039FC8CB9